MTNQDTPYGSVSYDQTGTQSFTGADGKTYTLPKYTQTTTLNPEQQSTLGYTQSAANNIAQTANSLSSDGLSSLSQPVDTSGAPSLQTGLGRTFSSGLGDNYSSSLGSNYLTNFGSDSNTEYNNAYNAVMNNATPTLDRNAEQQRAQEVASGIRPGSAAYSANEQTIGDNYTRASNQATLTAQDVENQLFNQQQQQAQFTDNALTNQLTTQDNAALQGQQFTNSADLNSANFNNDARSQYLSQYYQQRDQALNELSGLLSGSQVTNANTATSATPQTQVGGVDYSGLVEDQYNQEMQKSNNMMSGLFSLGSSAMGLGGKFAGSDIRIKKDIQLLMRFPNGLGLYAFRYKAKPEDQHIGFMAQEVMQHYPEAVHTHAEGYLMVDYAQAAKRLQEDIKGNSNG